MHIYYISLLFIYFHAEMSRKSNVLCVYTAVQLELHSYLQLISTFHTLLHCHIEFLHFFIFLFILIHFISMMVY